MERQVYFRNCAFAGLMSAALLMSVSCKKEEAKTEPEPAPVELKDQIEYNGGDLIDIKSAVYEVARNDVYTFYLSPTSGIADVEGMKTADDFLSVSVRSPKGTVDVSKEEFGISYAGLEVNPETMPDVKNLILTAALVKETSVLNLYVELEMVSGKTLLVRYGNKVVLDAPAELKNQLELDKKITPIGSVLEIYDFVGKSTKYCFYEDTGVTEPSDERQPAMQITVADGYDTKDISLPDADLEKLSVTCGNFTLENGTAGTISISRQELTGKLAVKVDAENTKGFLRADYTGACVRIYESANVLKVTQGDAVSETPLTKVFLYSNINNKSNVFMLGSQDAQEPAGLKEGGYAVKFAVSDLKLGETQDFADGNIPFSLYGYADYSTWDVTKASGAGASGELTVLKDGDAFFLRLSVEFKDGTKAEAEWFGVPTEAEDTDLTPEEPFRPRVYVTKPDGTVVLDKNIASMEMRMEKDYRLRGGDPQYGGAIFDAYFFYFRPEDATGGVEDRFSTPVIMLPASFIGSENLDLSKSQDGLHWSFSYHGGGFQQTEYSENYTMYNTTYGYCPKEVTITVRKEADKTWTIEYRMLDKYDTYGYDGVKESGYGNTVLIEWKGPAAKYSGTKKNDLSDEDY